MFFFPQKKAKPWERNWKRVVMDLSSYCKTPSRLRSADLKQVSTSKKGRSGESGSQTRCQVCSSFGAGKILSKFMRPFRKDNKGYKRIGNVVQIYIYMLMIPVCGVLPPPGCLPNLDHICHTFLNKLAFKLT